MGSSTPSARATASASTIMARITARVAGSLAMPASVPWVKALTGLKERLPQSFSQMSSRILGRTGALNPAPLSAFDSASTRSLGRPSGSPSMKRLP